MSSENSESKEEYRELTSVEEIIDQSENQGEDIEVTSTEGTGGVEIVFDPREITRDSRVNSDQEDTEIMTSDSHESGAYKGMPTFDGKKEKFQKFKLKFKAYANAKDSKKHLQIQLQIYRLTQMPRL